MRHTLVALIALGLAAPALAHPSDRAARETGAADRVDRTADRIDSPQTERQVQAMIGALLDLPVGRLVNAAQDAADPLRRRDPRDRVPDNATVGEIASGGDPNYSNRAREQSEAMAGAAAGVMRELARVLPTLQDAAARAADAARTPRNDDRRYPDDRRRPDDRYPDDRDR